jgi:hypothetical protein
MYQYLTPLQNAMGAAAEIPTSNAAIPADIDPAEFDPEAADEELAPEEEEGVVREEVTAARWMFPAALATQIFSIVPGVAGGLAGFVLASKLANAKSVKATEVLTAAGTVALVTFLAVFLVRTIDEFEEL